MAEPVKTLRVTARHELAKEFEAESQRWSGYRTRPEFQWKKLTTIPMPDPRVQLDYHGGSGTTYRQSFGARKVFLRFDGAQWRPTSVAVQTVSTPPHENKVEVGFRHG